MPSVRTPGRSRHQAPIQICRTTGRARAESLATMLKDARIGQIFITEFKRTRQTAEPLAKVLGVEPTVIAQKDVRAPVDRLQPIPATS